MAAPNIVNVATITGKTTYVKPSNTSDNVLVANSASSGKVFKINTIIAANLTSTTVAATVSINTAAGGGGTSYILASTVSIPANSSLIVVDKSEAIYLEEDRSILVKTTSANSLTFTTSYEELS